MKSIKHIALTAILALGISSSALAGDISGGRFGVRAPGDISGGKTTAVAGDISGGKTGDISGGKTVAGDISGGLVDLLLIMFSITG